MKLSSQTRLQLKAALKEDVGTGDITSKILIPINANAKGYLIAKESGIFCGETVAQELAKFADPRLRLHFQIKDGQRFSKGKVLLKISGNTQSLLKLERTLLNFLAKLSGIATLTRQFVKKVKGTRAQILDTRKTTPLWRELEKYAVRCGGGVNHRRGLWDEILVKDNHWTALQSVIARSPAGATKQSPRLLRMLRILAMTRKTKNIPIEVEVKNLKELVQLLEGTFTPDRILLDNFTLKELKRAVFFVHAFYTVLKSRYGIQRRRPLLEASGGIDLQNIREVARTGVDRISIGRLTHSAPSLDFSLNLKEVFG